MELQCNTPNEVLIKGYGRQKKRNKNKKEICIHIGFGVNVTIKTN